MKRPIYLAWKDAVYHILRISINGFVKVLEGLRVYNSGKKYDRYLEFCSCFLVNLWFLVFHGSRITLVQVLTLVVPCTRRPSKHVQVTLLLFTGSGVKP
jgi:hypothetical protein